MVAKYNSEIIKEGIIKYYQEEQIPVNIEEPIALCFTVNVQSDFPHSFGFYMNAYEQWELTDIEASEGKLLLNEIWALKYMLAKATQSMV